MENFVCNFCVKHKNFSTRRNNTVLRDCLRITCMINLASRERRSRTLYSASYFCGKRFVVTRYVARDIDEIRRRAKAVSRGRIPMKYCRRLRRRRRRRVGAVAVREEACRRLRRTRHAGSEREKCRGYHDSARLI